MKKILYYLIQLLVSEIYIIKLQYIINLNRSSLLFLGLSSIVFALSIDKIEFNKDSLDLTFNEPIIDGGNVCFNNYFCFLSIKF